MGGAHPWARETCAWALIRHMEDEGGRETGRQAGIRTQLVGRQTSHTLNTFKRERGRSEGSAINVCCSCRGQEFGPQNPHGGSQLLVMPAQADPLWSLWGHTNPWHIPLSLALRKQRQVDL